MIAFDVYLHGKRIDTIFYSDRHFGGVRFAADQCDEVRRSLVGHDGYDPAIVVKKARHRRAT